MPGNADPLPQAGCQVAFAQPCAQDRTPGQERKGDTMPRGVKKADLPQKTCATCGKPFTWRKKWEKAWEEVRYCSDRCRAGKAAAKLPRP
ncbi:DUF2256 domain-containing protein [Tabrizicola sp. YIM 78059]|uniref:DUF2256 domain-containing protein n=2 Tax=Tabrizicola TaxID=1443919 RepID=UPI00352D4452